MLPECEEILLDLREGVLSLTLNRPHKRNAMNAALLREVTAVFEAIADDRSVRAVVMRGAEGNFCSGADLSDMGDVAGGGSGSRDNAAWKLNRSFGDMITKVNGAPQVVVTLLEGAVMGGGFGLACVSDVAIADARAKFAMPETTLGIVPAQIAPFVVARIGLTQARRLALLGERIDGETALELGLVHFLTRSPEDMQARLEQVLERLGRCAPGANARTKALMLQVGVVEHERLLDNAADMFVESLNSPEGLEGTRAFLEKRRPGWAPS